MKGRIAVPIVVLVTIALLVGCAGVPKVKGPALKKAHEHELSGLWLTKDPKQMTGVPKDHIKLAVGETAVIYARGECTIEGCGKVFELPADVVVNWKADRGLEITPTTGHVVTVKVVEPISIAAYVTATTTTEKGKKIEALFTVTGK